MFVEPNAFEHSVHRNVSATQLAADFRLLRSMLKESPEFSDKFPGSVIIGPSTTRPKTKSLEYLSQYVNLLWCIWLYKSIYQSIKYLITVAELLQGLSKFFRLDDDVRL